MLCSCCCTRCAMAQARTEMDGSSCCLNFTLLNPVVLRWLARSAYGISGSAWDDCCLGTFCSCCVVNQVAQTIRKRGLPNPYASTAFNVNKPPKLPDPCCQSCGYFLYALWCTPCAMGTLMSESVKMPFTLACCCTPYGLVRSVLRHQYRLAGNECCEDCLLPVLLTMLPYGGPLFHAAFVAESIKLTKHYGYFGPYLYPMPSNMIGQLPQISVTPVNVQPVTNVVISSEPVKVQPFQVSH